MKIVCATSVLQAEEAFSTLGESVLIPDHEIGPDLVSDADALIVRTRTPVNEALLSDSRVAFVGSATAGIEHMDLAFLEAAEIAWCAAPGCNANSVAEYVIAALIELTRRHGLTLEHLTFGAVGVGHVGSKVVDKVEKLGLRVIKNDPPFQQATGAADYEPLSTVLREADVISLHVPLVRNGPWPTWHMANHRFFESVRPDCMFINTARGEVMDSEAVRYSLQHGALTGTAIDVWENEPYYASELAAEVDIATPHIAGLSLEGRLNGTWAVYHEACVFFERPPTWSPESMLAAHPAADLELDANGRLDEELLMELVRHAYDVTKDDDRIRAGLKLDREKRAQQFVAARVDYPFRREFPAFTVRLQNASDSLLEKAKGLGFDVTVA